MWLFSSYLSAKSCRSCTRNGGTTRENVSLKQTRSDFIFFIVVIIGIVVITSSMSVVCVTRHEERSARVE